MGHKQHFRNYRLDGPECSLAVDSGLVNAVWWRPPIQRQRLEELTKRSNARAFGDTALWLSLIVLMGYLLYKTWLSWWSPVLLLTYGGLYGGASDSRWHECSHGTAFRSPFLNTIVYYLASFMLWREPTVWRWSHYRHHTDTIIIGRDYEIAYQRPSKIWFLPLTFSHLVNGPKLLIRVIRHAFGNIDSQVASYVPESEFRKVFWEARVFLCINLGSLMLSLTFWSIFPIVFIGLPTIYGAWLFIFFGLTQHAGLQENVLDHRKNTRTVLMNPIFGFLYSNMNYHLEHHLFPEVPYYALPLLNDELAPYLPTPSPSCWHAYREIISIMRKQSSDITEEITSRNIPNVPSSIRNSDSILIPEKLNFKGDHALTKLEDLPVGSMRRIEHASRTYLLCRLSKEEVILSDGLCTHGEAFLSDGVLNGTTIECPKHNGRFDLRSGEAIRNPAKDDLNHYTCSTRKGIIQSNFHKI
ncbi:MAG: fatty acid desaturase [Acidimicrobiales bacterium]|nr:fatty acid desaturase [Acidimicrobiales bacterium]